jgi:hypothetical protein
VDEERRGVPNFFFQRAGALAAAEVQRQRGWGWKERELRRESCPRTFSPPPPPPPLSLRCPRNDLHRDPRAEVVPSLFSCGCTRVARPRGNFEGFWYHVGAGFPAYR